MDNQPKTRKETINIISFSGNELVFIYDIVLIFTNDIPYAQQYFKDIPVIEELELDCLYLMSQAKGCIV